jgi:hypothetical protein
MTRLITVGKYLSHQKVMDRPGSQAVTGPGPMLIVTEVEGRRYRLSRGPAKDRQQIQVRNILCP